MACEGLNRGIFVDAAFPVNGGLRLDLPVTLQRRLTQRIRTRLGAGGPPVRAVTTNGGVTVRTR